MATKKKPHVVSINKSEIPDKIEDGMFFGIIPDDEQKLVIDSVWKREKKVFMIDSVAGSGKTLISTALGVLMVKYGIYEKIIYITFPGVNERAQGFLPGNLQEKSDPYFQPLYDALIKIGEDPDRVCCMPPYNTVYGDLCVQCAVSTYMRGINIDNAFVIIDEAENADMHTLSKVLSRINDSCTVLLIGHSGQCDLVDKSRSGFAACVAYQKKHNPGMCQSFKLHHNHRGFISEWADLMSMEYKEPQFGFIYETTNNINGKKYIGKHKRTMDPNDIDDSWYLGSGKAFVNAVKKYGKENFSRRILYECNSQDMLDYMEEVFIMYFKADKLEEYYNIVIGGISGMFSGHHHTDEAKRKIGEAASGEKNYWYGKHLSEDVKKKISAANKGRHTGQNHYLFGKKRPIDFCKKLSIAKGTPVRCVESGIVYHSAREAERMTGIRQSVISSVCRGEGKTAGKLHWEYAYKDGGVNEKAGIIHDRMQKVQYIEGKVDEKER